MQRGSHKRKKEAATREQSKATWHAQEGALILIYATTSTSLMLLHPFLENRRVISTHFTASQNSWGPTTSTLALRWRNFGPVGMRRATKFVPALWEMIEDQKMCIAYFILHNNKPLLGTKVEWKNFLHIGG